jgi:hypothetical protein
MNEKEGTRKAVLREGRIEPGNSEESQPTKFRREERCRAPEKIKHQPETHGAYSANHLSRTKRTGEKIKEKKRVDRE